MILKLHHCSQRMNLWKWLLCFSIVSSRPPFHSASHIYQTVNGTIESNARINFTLFVTVLKGVIVQMFDSFNNQLGVEVTIGGHSERNISLRFNKGFMTKNIFKTCGCSPCEDTRVHFIISVEGGLARLRCNGHGYIDLLRVKGIWRETYPMPATVANGSQKTLIMIGNMGPYKSADGSTVNPVRMQMVGCLVTFFLGDRKVTFLGGDDRVMPSCMWMCYHDLCHGGECKERWPDNRFCDCHMMAHNGPFCNRSLTKYDKGVNNCYKVIQAASEVQMKMTWKNVGDKHFCLMEVVSGYGRATLSVNKSAVFVDSEAVGHISNDGVNFVSVNISSNRLTVKINNKQSTKISSIMEASLINIGFSNGDNKCETFEGTYDLHFDPSQLRLILPTSASTSPVQGGVTTTTVTTVATTVTTVATTVPNKTNYVVILIILVIILMTMVASWYVANIWMSLRRRHKEQNGNMYEQESISLSIVRDNVGVNPEEPEYSAIDGEHFYMNNINQDEDINGYMIPHPRNEDVDEPLPPLLPPRD